MGTRSHGQSSLAYLKSNRLVKGPVSKNKVVGSRGMTTRLSSGFYTHIYIHRHISIHTALNYKNMHVHIHIKTKLDRYWAQ